MKIQNGHSAGRNGFAGTSRPRRGNVLVLVAGILVLLVIIATSYLSRTGAEREISVVAQDKGLANDRARVVAEGIAQEIAEKLFPRPIHPNSLSAAWGPDGISLRENPNYHNGSFDPPLAIEPLALPFSIDRDADGNGLPDFWWNVAPYSTKPWTNWPDFFVDTFDRNGNLIMDDPRADDLPGNPGTNDFRLLADTEPARLRVPFVLLPVDPTWSFRGEAGFDLFFVSPDVIDYHTHWLHMSNPMRPGNGWIVVNDISNIEGSIFDALNSFAFGPGPYGVPFEQWLPHTQTGLTIGPASLVPANFDPNTGKNYFPATGWPTFRDQWIAWFNDYGNAYIGASPIGGIPANYYRLADCGLDLDLLGGNTSLEPGERPQDEYIGPGMTDDLGTVWVDGTPRYNISRILADADGDGFTDSFWFQAPTSAESDLRTLVAMRVVDLSGLANVSAWTQFVRGRPTLAGIPTNHGTRGHTPADVALYEDISEGQAFVGLFGTPEHWEGIFPDNGLADDQPGSPWGETQVVFNPLRWSDPGSLDFLEEVGPTLTADLLDLPIERLDYWRRTGMHPFDPISPYGAANQRFTPFSMADQSELFAFRGSNQQWMLSPLEQALSTNISGPNQMFRSTVGREEVSEYLDQLDVRPIDADGAGGLVYFDELLHDMRRQLTTFSTARNETMPPWLWWGYRFNPADDSWTWPYVPGAFRNTFIAQSMRKLDLRELRRNHFDPLVSPFRTMPQRLVPTLLLALTDGEQYLAAPKNRFYFSTNVGGTFDSTQRDYEDASRMATSLASNIVHFQDNDDLVDNATGLPPADGIDDFNAVRAFPDLTDPSATGALRVPGDANLVAPGFQFAEGAYDDNERYMGLEAQPFILEAFIAHVYEDARVVDPGTGPVNSVDSTSNQTTIVVVQVANPFERPIDLSHYKLRIFGQLVDLRGVLLPATEEAPRSAIFYSIEGTFGDDGATFKPEWLDYLDLTAADLFGVVGSPGVPGLYDTLLLDADDITLYVAPPVSKDITGYNGTTSEAVELLRTVQDATGLGTIDVVIDRIDNPQTDPNLPNQETDPSRYRDDVVALATDAQYVPPPPLAPTDGIWIGQDDYFVVWARATRVWRDDFDGNDRVIQDHERGPRFIFSSHHDGFQAQSDPDLPETQFSGAPGGLNAYRGDSYDAADLPDGTPGTADPWIVRGTYRDPARIARVNRKPVFFTCYSTFDPLLADVPVYRKPLTIATDIYNLADKGVKANDDYFYPHPLQMLLKNDSFEQVGELLNVFVFGHLLDVDAATNIYNGTISTFSEHMSNPLMVGDPDLYPSGVYARTNRLLPSPQIATRTMSGTEERILGQVVGTISGLFNANSTTAFPDMPAGARALSAFVCDGPGYNAFNVDANLNGIMPFDALGNLVDPEDLELQTFYNAGGFRGAGTPGLININTASIEVFRALPHLYRLVHEDNLDDGGFLIQHLDPFDALYEFGAGRSRLPEAMIAYKERLGDLGILLGGDDDPLPMYGSRGLNSAATSIDPLNQSRGDRGFESIGEIALLDRPGRSGADTQWDRSFRVDQAALNHLASTAGGPAQVDVNLSTDLQDRYDPATNLFVYDETANDDEEANLLFAGLSNLVTTRSDSFAVWLKIRNVRQGSDGRWNGLDPKLIVDESRYLMIVDRSNVNLPSDKPRILLFEELPN
jgi:hypothetical protein